MTATTGLLFPPTCAVVLCPRLRALEGVEVRPFCAEHDLDFKASPEGKTPRHNAAADYRDREWKERCKIDEEKKRAQLERDAREKTKP